MAEVYTRQKSEQLENLITAFFNKNDIYLKNDTDIIAVCKKLGISVNTYLTKKDGYDGFILVNDDFKTIGIDESLEPKDRRFLIAHELGHYITADSKDKNILLAHKDNLHHGCDKTPEEHDADYLAAAILVPNKQFRRELDLLAIDYKNLTTEEKVADKISPILIEFFANRYRVKEQLIIRRIAEVAAYA